MTVGSAHGSVRGLAHARALVRRGAERRGRPPPLPRGVRALARAPHAHQRREPLRNGRAHGGAAAALARRADAALDAALPLDGTARSARGRSARSRTRARHARGWPSLRRRRRGRSRQPAGASSVGRVRLSELGELDTASFELFLELLADALANQPHPRAPVEVTSTDGTLLVRLEPVGDGSIARIETSLGVLSGPDCWIELIDLATLPARSEAAE
ncbi:MAG: DUF2397 domain-containing protein [Sandaracinaceae bacterium]|nr:DUF2397 domain-containing protein [Sandaracinaceae bacterium]